MVVEGRDRRRQLLRRLHLVPELEGLQHLGLEVPRAHEQIGRCGRREQISIDARRRPNRPRRGGPDRVRNGRSPREAGAGLILEARIVVVFELGPHGHPQAVPD